ncbi:hypothetical protein [Ralstonia pseudosolanacearum]|uniref:Uncharacterized protein n=1 Tax=Ralstonia solanacearum TaxID=305 RepID=A0ABY6NFX9_RALSL|nr:hypothetical protein LH706_06820 [Ralstonia solanacearum]
MLKREQLINELLEAENFGEAAVDHLLAFLELAEDLCREDVIGIQKILDQHMDKTRLNIAHILRAHGLPEKLMERIWVMFYESLVETKGNEEEDQALRINYEKSLSTRPAELIALDRALTDTYRQHRQNSSAQAKIKPLSRIEKLQAILDEPSSTESRPVTATKGRGIK